MSSKTRQKSIWLPIIGVLASISLLSGGTLLPLLTFWPVIASQFNEPADFFGELPLSPERQGQLINPEDIPPRQPYPALRTSLPDTNTSSWIRIPSINIAVPLAQSPTMSDRDILQTLNHGAALYPNGILPGQLGNTFISAHSTGQPWKGKYRFAFLHLDKLETGNQIHLDFNNARYTYRVTDKEIITPTPDYRVESGRPIPTITFMACWPLWTTNQRLLVTGQLTNITQLTTKPS